MTVSSALMLVLPHRGLRSCPTRSKGGVPEAAKARRDAVSTACRRDSWPPWPYDFTFVIGSSEPERWAASHVLRKASLSPQIRAQLRWHPEPRGVKQHWLCGFVILCLRRKLSRMDHTKASHCQSTGAGPGLRPISSCLNSQQVKSHPAFHLYVTINPPPLPGRPSIEHARRGCCDGNRSNGPCDQLLLAAAQDIHYIARRKSREPTDLPFGLVPDVMHAASLLLRILIILRSSCAPWPSPLSQMPLRVGSLYATLAPPGNANRRLLALQGLSRNQPPQLQRIRRTNVHCGSSLYSAWKEKDRLLLSRPARRDVMPRHAAVTDQHAHRRSHEKRWSVSMDRQGRVCCLCRIPDDPAHVWTSTHSISQADAREGMGTLLTTAAKRRCPRVLKPLATCTFFHSCTHVVFGKRGKVPLMPH